MTDAEGDDDSDSSTLVASAESDPDENRAVREPPTE
jgi:hypothetical protein